jgi:hypothetical protein
VCWSCWGAAPCSRCCDDARAAAMMRALHAHDAASTHTHAHGASRTRARLARVCTQVQRAAPPRDRQRQRVQRGV